MEKNRLEAFSDGVLAIIITILALELKWPQGNEIRELTILVPKLVSYLLSFIYIGAFWINHHHMLHTVRKVTDPSYGQICIYSSGYPCYHFLQAGWVRTFFQNCQ